MLTWKDFFRIVEEMYNINPEDISIYLDVDAGTISKHKKGKLKKFTSRSNEEIFAMLFSPNSGIVPLKWNESELLSLLKEAIETTGFRGVMEDLWGNGFPYKKGEYETFVMALLNRINLKWPKGATLYDLMLHYSPTAAAQHLHERRWNSNQVE
jgi:hypothetical protein